MIGAIAIDGSLQLLHGLWRWRAGRPLVLILFWVPRRYGSHLTRRLVELCTEDQRTQLIQNVAPDLVAISQRIFKQAGQSTHAAFKDALRFR